MPIFENKIVYLYKHFVIYKIFTYFKPLKFQNSSYFMDRDLPHIPFEKLYQIHILYVKIRHRSQKLCPFKLLDFFSRTYMCLFKCS